ncbi:hypothetical protein BaRGS_00012375 [Batillaria attramentaria]|uniref:Amino acid transporter transmembrane domain-containing protein n=1 Tax=Batillaria attramentaria TaxID=370345 RepID=A0ABD0LB29_9CAEN
MAGGGPAGPGSKHPVKIFANIFIAFIGAGVLGLPYAFKEAGILEGIFIMTFVAVISAKAMLLIVDCKYKILGRNVKGISPGMTLDIDSEENDGLVSGEPTSRPRDFLQEEGDLMIRSSDLTYGDVGYHALGHTGRMLVDLAIVISQTGFCCAYIIFITENLSDYIVGVKLWQWLFILLPPLYLLTLLRHLSSLALSSLLAQMSNLMAFGVVFWFDFEHLFKITMHPKEMSLKGFPFFMAIAIYCYEGAGMILALEASMAEEIRHKFKKYFTTAMFVVTSLYITFGACGYLSFGPDTKAIITLNLPKGLGLDFSMLVKSCLCLGIFFTYPVMLFPVNRILETYFLQDGGKTVWKGNLVRFVLVLTTGVVVQAIPNFANLMALVGASCCTLLAFILPGLFHMNIFKDSLTRSQKMLDWCLIFVGIFGTIIGVLDALKRLSEDPSAVDEVHTVVVPTTVENITAAAASNISHIIAPSHVTPAPNLALSLINNSVAGGVISHGGPVTAAPSVFTTTLLNASTLGLNKTAAKVVGKLLNRTPT